MTRLMQDNYSLFLLTSFNNICLCFTNINIHETSTAFAHEDQIKEYNDSLKFSCGEMFCVLRNDHKSIRYFLSRSISQSETLLPDITIHFVFEVKIKTWNILLYMRKDFSLFFLPSSAQAPAPAGLSQLYFHCQTDKQRLLTR